MKTIGLLGGTGWSSTIGYLAIKFTMEDGFFAPSFCLFLAYIIMYVLRKGKKMEQKMHQKSN